MTYEQALNNLYLAARLSPLKADEHDLLRKCAEQLLPLAQKADKLNKGTDIPLEAKVA